MLTRKAAGFFLTYPARPSPGDYFSFAVAKHSTTEDTCVGPYNIVDSPSIIAVEVCARGAILQAGLFLFRSCVS